MERFIVMQNIERYRHMLGGVGQDAERHKQIAQLLAEAIDQLDALEGRGARLLYPTSGPERPRP